MNDGIIKNDGTSRLMRATLPATYEEFKRACEAGTQPLDVLFNEAGWAQLPDFLNKGNLLKDQTATMFGLNSDSKVNDVFSWIGKYNQHWWRRRLPAGMRYVESKTALNTTTEIVNENHTCSVSKQISINQNTGKVTLVNPETISVSGLASSATTAMRDLIGKSPCYVQLDSAFALSNGILYLPEGATSSTKEYDTTTLYRPYLGGYYVATSESSSPVCQVVTSSQENIQAGEWEYFYSSDRSAYPDSGEQDGYEYEYMGIPFDNAVGAPMIEAGSYVGTGKKGANNPNSLSFTKTPSVVFVQGLFGSPNTTTNGILVLMESGGYWFRSGGVVYGVTISSWGESISWYGTNDDPNYAGSFQGNVSKETYHYVAIE